MLLAFAQKILICSLLAQPLRFCSRMNEQTNSQAAMDLLLSEIFVANNGDRNGVPDRAIFITDGSSNVFPEQTIPDATRVKNNGKSIPGATGIKNNSKRIQDATWVKNNGKSIPDATWVKINGKSDVLKRRRTTF